MKQPPTHLRIASVVAALLMTLALLLPAAAAADTSPQTGAINGVVFRDYNANGTRENTASFREPGVGGVLIRAYDANNTLAGSATSAADGTYSFTATGASGFRVEFTLPTDGSLDFLQAGAAVAATGNTTVVFVPTGGQTGLNVGFNNPSDFSQANPPLITTRTAFGPRLASGGMAGLPSWSSGASANPNESVIGIAYDADGNLTNSNAHNVYATLRQTGTLYGLIYGRRAQLILAGTFFKSYADTGPMITGQSGNQWEWLNNVSPLGAIYGIQPTALAANPADIPTATNARVYANLNKIIDPATGVIVPGNPAGVDPRRTGTINYDAGSFGDCDGPGTGGGPASPSAGNTCWHHDPVAWDKVGSIGLGDLEQDDAEKFFFVVNLGDKKLYQLPIVTDPAQWPIKTLAASPLAIPNTCANSADAVPGGLGFKDGKLYIGVTCTAESNQNLADLKAEIWQFNPKTQAFSAAPVFSMPLGYPRGCIFASTDNPGTTSMKGVNAPKNVPAGLLTSNCQQYKDGSPNTIDNSNWLPWPATWEAMFEGNKGINSYGKPGQANADMVQIEYPHPWLSDISFDGDDLVIGFRDTAGDRTGNFVRTPNLTTTTVVPATITNVDNFAAQNFTGSNGSTGWGGSWSETGDDGSATGGDIQVLADTALSAPNYQLRISGASNTIQRTASNTFSTGVGTLSFAYRRVGLESNDAVNVDVSTNNGSTWTTVFAMAGAADDPTYRTAVIDISLSNQTIIRFSTNSTMTTGDIVWIDNVRVTNQSRTWMSQYVYGNADSAYTGAGFGDLMRACKSGGGWTLESNGSCGGVTTGGANNGQGPGSGTYPDSIGSPFNGYGEFYWDDSGPGSRNPSSANAGISAPYYIGHEQTMQGGTFQQPGSPDIAVTISDQFGYGDGGLARFSNVVDHPGVTNYDANGNLLTGSGALLTFPTILSDNNASNNSEAGLALKHTQLYSNAGSFFGKANGLGDVEALLNSPPLEIGNRIWCDTGVSGAGANNGIQDPGEAVPSTAVTVRLTCGAEYAEVSTNTTTGAYLFTDTIWNNSANTTSTVIPREATCKISVATTGANGTALTNACGGIAATVSDADGKTDNAPLTDIRDSDGTVVRSGGSITSAEVTFLTGGPGVNNHSLDIAFGPERDWGDAPDPNYPTLISSNGARHTIVANKRMGATIDSEQNGQPNTGATGDDLATSDDEDGVTFGALAAGQPAIANIDMTTLPAGEVCRLNAWIDFNGNGSWLDAGEQIATNVALNGGAVQTLNFTVPQAVTTSPTYARFRCSTQQNLTPSGLATDGEVEDYQVTIQQTGNLDYGDAPDPTYPTLSANGGASHLLGAAGPRLGACVDAETNGQPNAGALGDDSAKGAPVYGTCANDDDEDGVTFPTLTEGSQANLTVNVSQAACQLNAWVDWNGDGDWNDAGEQIATNAPMIIGANSVPVTPPAASTQAATYARFRCNTSGGLGATGAAADGEIEDYAISVQPGTALNDWGDAPDTGTGTGAGNYQTIGTDNGAHHLIAGNTWLGACVDAEVDGQPNTGATGDDTATGTTGYGTCAVAGDDEDGVTIPTLLAGQTAQLQVARNASAAACSLNGWIDFNGDGDWNDTGEQVATNVALATGANNLNVAVPASAVGGQTYARFRCSTVQNLKPTGVATDGEVEDYAVSITATAVDWGDLPDPLYPTLSGSNGAAHALSGVAFLGKCVDAEANGQPDANATLDDTNATTPRLGACATGNDDEDGVTFTLPLNAGQTGTASVDMTAFQTGANVCFLNAWIDFNGNGLLTDAGEQIASNVQMVGGAVRTVNFSIPVAVTASPTGARFRCSTQSGLTPTGQANDGEVEDYMVTLAPQVRDFGDAPDTGAGTSVGNYATTVGDNGPNHLITAGLNLGNVAPDQDSGALQNANADADDTTGAPDDEDGIATLPTILTTTTSLQMTVRATNTAATAATLACWIDFNRDGSFLGAGEKSATVSVPASSGGADYTVNFSGFGAPVAGDTYIRCRLAYVASEISGPTGPAASGEIEDFKVTIIQPQDFGDLPDTTANTGAGDYQTLLANNGPRHIIVSGVQLGAQIDAEVNGQPSIAATGDDLAGATPDDEDGVVFANPLVPGKKANIQVTASVAGCLNAWVDWNGNGVLTDSGEQIATDLAVTSGANTITVSSVPAGTTGVVYSRFRFTQQCGQGGATPTGPASNGEVEDYALASLGDFVWNDTNGNGQQDDGPSSGQAGVTVKLLNGSGNPVNDADGNPITVVTDANGKYEFPGLPPGTYIVEFAPPVGSGFTTPNAGNDATDSDADPTTGRSGPVTLGPADSNTTVDAGLVPLPLDFGDLPDTTANTGAADYQTLLANNGPRHVIVTGVRLGAAVDSEADGQPTTPALGDDLNGAPDDEDGVVFQTPLMPGFQGKIQVTASVAGCLNAWVDWNGNGVLTDAGEQIAADLAVIVGANMLSVNPVPQTTGVVYSRFRFTQACGQGAGTPLGLASTGEVEDYALASLGDYVWNDTDKDGVQDGTETGVAGVTVKLLDSAGNPVLDGAGNPIIDVTDNDGKYEFPGLPPGTYRVEFVPPTGSSLTQPDQGGDDAKDSDADVANGRTPSVTLGAGDVDTTLDAGLVPVADTAIGNMVWCDANQDAVKQTGESAIAGVTVKLYNLGPNNTPYDGDDVVLRTLVTDGNGRYVFLAVPAGSYYVAVDSTTVPSGCNVGSSPGGGHNPDIGDQDVADGDDGAPLKLNETVSGVITTVIDGQTTSDTGNPLGYTSSSAYMTVDFGFTPGPTAVKVQDLQAAPVSIMERIVEQVLDWLKR